MHEALAEPRAGALAVRAAHHHRQGQAGPDPHRSSAPAARRSKRIVDQTGCAIDVEDDGTVNDRFARHGQPSKKAIEIIKGLTLTPEVGEIYKATVERVEDFGAFVEIVPGNDGLLHISEIDERASSASRT